MRLIHFASCLVVAGLVFLAACSDGDNPSTPAEVVDHGDYPAIPKPASANAEAPMQSESLIAIVPNKADFVGTVNAGIATWEIHERARVCGVEGFVSGLVEDDIIQIKQDTHSDDLKFMGSDITRRVKPWRVVWMEDGQFVEPWTNDDIAGFSPTNGRLGFNSWYPKGQGECANPQNYGDDFPWRFYWVKKCPKISSPVYLKRERFWVRVPADGQGAPFVRLDGNVKHEVSTAYKQGINIENSETYAHTVSASVGGGAAYVASVTASISESITASFGYSMTVSVEETVTVTETVYGETGKIVIFMLWELVERYSVVDADGNPYTDASYTFEEGTGSSEVRGVGLALDATAFDAR